MKPFLSLKSRMITMLICCSIIFTCITLAPLLMKAKTLTVFENKYLFLYSNPFKNNTYIVSTNDGRSFHKTSYDINDTPTLIRNHNNELILPAEHISKKYIVKDDFSISEQSQEAPYSFLIDLQDIQIEGLNVSYAENLLRVNDRKMNKTYNIKLPAYLANATYDQNNIYVLNYNTTTENNELHIISRTTGTLTHSYIISEGATEMLAVNDYLFLSTDNSLTKLDIRSGKIEYIKYPLNVAFADTLYLDQNNDLFVCFVDFSGNAGLLILNKNYNSIDKNIKLNVGYLKSKFENNKLYILSQMKDHAEGGAKFAIVDLRSLQIEQVFQLPVLDTKVQDFLVLD